MSDSSEPQSKLSPTRDISSTSRSLLVRLRDDDADAWDRLVSLYAPLVYHWCRKFGLAEQDAADIVQDVFKSVMTNIGRFRKDRPQDTFRGWLRVITRSKVMDHFRRQSRQPTAVGGSVALRRLSEFPDLVDEPETTSDSGDDSACHALFLRACELIRTDFRENTWKAFWRVVVDGQSPKDVAAELSMKPGTVRVAKSRVLQRLRQELGDALD